MDSTFEYFGLKTTSEEDYELLAAVEDWIYYSLSSDEIDTITDEDYIGLVVDMFKILVKPPYHGKRRNRPRKQTFWEGVARFTTSDPNTIKSVNFYADQDIKSVDDLRDFVRDTVQGVLVSYDLNGESFLVGGDNFDDDALLEHLNANENFNCVSVFRNKYELSDEYYDGMKLKEFLQLATRDNIQVFNNDGLLLNRASGDIKVCAFGGHVLDYMPEFNHPHKSVLCNHDELLSKYKSIREDKNKLINRIKVYDGFYGLYLKSFCCDNVIYKNDYMNPTDVIKRYFKRFSCSFYHQMTSNFAVANGRAVDCAGYDLNGAYVQALSRVKQIPIIDNIPMSYEIALKLFNAHDLVVLCEEQDFGKVRFPACLWYAEDVEKYHLKPIEAYYVKKFLDFDFNDLYAYLNEYSGTNETDGRNKWNESALKIAFGAFLVKHSHYVRSNMSYLDDILSPEHKHYIVAETNEFFYSPNYYHNVHFAMSSEYHHLLLEFMAQYPVEAVYIDCLYVKADVPVKVVSDGLTGFKYEKYVEDYNVKYAYAKATQDIKLIVGPAGSGKSYYLKHHVAPLCKTLVIVPERRLSLVWEGFECQTIQFISKKKFMPSVNQIIIDECFKFDTDDLSDFLGFCRSNDITVWMAGDHRQFQQINITREKKRIYCMMPVDKRTGNYRNSIDYNTILSANSQEQRQQFFDTYLSNYTVSLESKDIFDEINYCYITKEGGTRDIYDKAYKRHVYMNNLTKNIFARCTHNAIINGTQYYNGMIYRLDLWFINKHKSVFTISNTYSIYATQGQTMDKIRLISDDEKYYTSTNTMLYVLISRLKA